jgi:hypothetical protein
MNQKLRKAIRADVKKAREKRRQKDEKQKPAFSKRYDKLVKYDFPGRINMERHFFFPKIFGPGQFGPKWSKAEIAVYPVLCSRANFEHNDWFQFSQDNLAKQAGVSVDTIHKGTRELVDGKYKLTKESDPLLEMKKTSEGPRHFYLYRVTFIRKDMIERWKGEYFLFHTCIIESGVWSNLKPRAKALYLALRSVAIQDYQLYRDIEHENGFDWMTPYDEYLRDRNWDVVDCPLAELGRLVGINVTNIKLPLQQLERFGLVERIDRWWKVYLRPRLEQFD